jgi:hypothetical protein
MHVVRTKSQMSIALTLLLLGVAACGDRVAGVDLTTHHAAQEQTATQCCQIQRTSQMEKH